MDQGGLVPGYCDTTSIKFKTEVVEDEYSASDRPTSGNLDDADREKVFKTVQLMYDQAIKTATANVTAFIKQEFQPTTQMSPVEHFVMKQSCLGAVKLLLRIEKEKLAYDDIRDYFENLGYLLDLVTARSQPACCHLAKLMVFMMRQLGELGAHLEDLSQRQVTNWMKLSGFYEEYYQKTLVKAVATPPPSIKNFSAFTAIACGTFGTVHACKFGIGLDLMVKIVNKKNNKATKSPFNATLVGCMSRHPLLIQTYCTFVTNEAYINVMEFFSGVDLQRVNAIQAGLPTEVVCVVLAQLCLAVEYLHYLGFMHRDIKPSNILINPECRIRLIDFDTCKICIGLYSARYHIGFGRRTAREFKDNEKEGTLAFMAPELLVSDQYGRSVDWWSIGVTGYTLRCGKVPFAAKKEKEMKKLLKKPDVSWTVKDDSPMFKHLKSLIRQLIKVSIKERLCSGDYQEYRKHPFFASTDWQYVEQNDSILSYKLLWEMLQDVDGKFRPLPQEPTKKEKKGPDRFCTALYIHV